MRQIFLVALHEYLENARTKGFWFGILILPVMLIVAVQVPQYLEKATPTRHFVLVDQSGKYQDTIEKAVERLHQRAVFREFGEYVKKYSKEAEADAETPKIDLETLPAIDIETMVEDFANDNPELLDGFVTGGGIDMALAQVAPMLKDDAPEFEEPKRQFQQVSLPPDLDLTADLADVSSELRSYLTGKSYDTTDHGNVSLFAAILIPADVEDQVKRPGFLPDMGMTRPNSGGTREGIQYWATNLADADLRNEIQRIVNRDIRAREFERLDVDQSTVEKVQDTRMPFTSLNPGKEVGKEEVSMADQVRQYAPIGFVYLLWIGIFTISQMLLNNTIEEKSNRIIEVLLSSVTARELMLGKLSGIAAIGLTMIGTWIASLLAVLSFMRGPETELLNSVYDVVTSSSLLPLFAVYFTLGYLLYSGFFLAIGSVCNTLKEAQNLMGPIMIIMVVPLLTMTFIPKDPNGTIATALSWVPLYTPFIMMNRAAANPPMVDTVGTLILLVFTTLLMLWLTGKIFRVGVLRTGQPPKISEMLRWLRS